MKVPCRSSILTVAAS